MQSDLDTIVAISTKLGVGAISIIRVSGKEAIKIVNQIFKGKDLEKVDSHTIHYGYIIEGQEKVDEVLVTIMKAPKTYTTEDVVEINCHGGLNTTLKIFELLQLKGARVASPGEFTKRAFLNGRIDLTQAEAVMDIIDSKSDKARKMALTSLEGKISNYIQTFRDKLKQILANIAVNIDYPEYYDIEEITTAQIKELIEQLKNNLNDLICRSEDSQMIKNGIKTVIVGRPNVGKSSILNTFLNQNKAIVTDIEGTTRDIVEGTILFDGIELNLIDTAGIRNTENVVEKIGVENSLKLIDEADLIIVVLNISEELTENDNLILNRVKDKNPIIVLNKNDLPNILKKQDFHFEHIVTTNTNVTNGIDTLKEEIKKMFHLEKIEENDYTYLSNTRQIILAHQALDSILSAESSLIKQMPIDIIEIDLQEAFSTLGEITGQNYNDELLDELFSNFCVGK